MTTHARLFEWSIVPLGLPLAAAIVWHARDPQLVVVVVTVSIGALVCWIAVQDLKAFTISDSAILTLAMLGVAYRWSVSLGTDGSALGRLLAPCLDALLPGGMLLLFRETYYRCKGTDGLGLGDVKLAAVGGLLIGAIGLSWALAVASALGLAFVGCRHLFLTDKPFRGSEKMAFGALLAPAIWTIWLAEQLPSLLPLPYR